MIRFRILVELMVVTLMMLVPQNNSETDMMKYPYQILVQGRMKCHNKGAYAVLINIFEKVKYIRYGNVIKGILRTGSYFLSERDGKFSVEGSRYSMDHEIYLNITHHCMLNNKRNIYKNCFMQVSHEIEGDPRTVRYELNDINLELIQYQSGNVKCVDWPYKYPDFIKKDDL